MKVENEGKKVRVTAWKNHYLLNPCQLSVTNSRKCFFTHIDGHMQNNLEDQKMGQKPRFGPILSPNLGQDYFIQKGENFNFLHLVQAILMQKRVENNGVKYENL